MNANQSSRKEKPFHDLGAMLLFIVLLPLIVVALVAYLIYRVSILVSVWLLWCTNGKFVLFVHSDSPIWKEYVADHFLPRLQEHAVILNWSERRSWTKRFSLPVMAFRAIGGMREFNPIGVVFRPFRFSKVFRFWKPFKDFKHGNKQSLEKMEKEFFALVDSIQLKRSA